MTKQAEIKPDFIERRTAELLKRAKKSGYFMDALQDARRLESDGYVWDVALSISVNYWAS
jgi:hypothetical protein